MSPSILGTLRMLGRFARDLGTRFMVAYLKGVLCCNKSYRQRILLNKFLFSRYHLLPALPLPGVKILLLSRLQFEQHYPISPIWNFRENRFH